MGPSHALLLNTTSDPRSVIWSGIRVTLVELTPPPYEEEPTMPEEYAVRLYLDPLG